MKYDWSTDEVAWSSMKYDWSMSEIQVKYGEVRWSPDEVPVKYSEVPVKYQWSIVKYDWSMSEVQWSSALLKSRFSPLDLVRYTPHQSRLEKQKKTENKGKCTEKNGIFIFVEKIVFMDAYNRILDIT